ncbi:unnamed protein product [Cochlearia groenlandica]
MKLLTQTTLVSNTQPTSQPASPPYLACDRRAVAGSSTHIMVTRSKNNIVKPNPRYGFSMIHLIELWLKIPFALNGCVRLNVYLTAPLTGTKLDWWPRVFINVGLAVARNWPLK